MPTVLAAQPAPWPVLAAGLLAISVPLLVLAAAWRLRQASPRQASPWVWVALLTTIAVLGFFSRRPPAPGPTAPGSPAWVWALVMLPPLGVLALVGLLVWQQRRSPILRAARRANDGDLAGAIAMIEARVAARRGAAPPPAPAPARDEANPYAAPAATASPAERQALAEDLNVLGIFEGMRRDWARALDYYERAEGLVAEPMPIVRANRATALVNLGRPAEGLALLDEVLGVLPPADHLTRCNCQCSAATALLDLGRPAEARDRLERAEAAVRQVGRLAVGSRATWDDQIAALRARLAAAEAPEAVADPADPPTPT